MKTTLYQNALLQRSVILRCDVYYITDDKTMCAFGIVCLQNLAKKKQQKTIEDVLITETIRHGNFYSESPLPIEHKCIFYACNKNHGYE